MRLGELERVGEVLGHVLDHHPEPTTHDLALGAQLLDDRLGEIRGNREADSHVATGFAEDRAVDADHLAVDVQQRAARIAGIDRGIRLNEVIVRALADHAALGADDACRHGLLETEGIADRHHPIADTQVPRIPELQGRNLSLRLYLHQRDIGLRIGAENLGLVLMLSRRKLHEDLVGMFDHVVVGDDQAVGADGESGPEAALFVALRHLRHEASEELLEGVVLPEGARAAAPFP